MTLPKITIYEITYHPTGRHTDEDKVWITNTDFKEYGVKDQGIAGAIKTFEKIAEINWKTYETQYAITNIKITER